MSAASGAARASADDARIRAFLAESLALWRVAADVAAVAAPGVAVIRTHAGVVIRVERAAPAEPFRWWVRAGRAAGGAAADPALRPRPCGSLAGVLNAMRSALGIERGRAVRIVAAPESE